LQKLVQQEKILFIDEVQNYPEVTLPLKILYDDFKIKIIATGSSELRRKGRDFDTLANRYEEIFCLPFSLQEIGYNTQIKKYEETDFLQRLLAVIPLYGSYPEIYLAKEKDRPELLQKLLEAYVLKDIIDLYDLKNAKLAKDILLKIALQLGSEVSIREIANSLQANVTTVASYLEIFLKNYILIALPAFRLNLRRAVSSNRKLYFYDLGIRNILIQDFRPLPLRPDSGAVFENFVISEVEKRRKIERQQKQLFFYREYSGREVDLVAADYFKKYRCAEIKMSRVKALKVFPLAHRLEVINQDNYFAKINSFLK
jgi:predicted AAA+ superfamily ATPase